MAVIYAHFCDEMQLASALCFHSWGYITLGLFYLPVEMQTSCLHSIYNRLLPSCMFMKHGAFMDSVSEALQGTTTVSADSLHDPDGKNASGGSCTLWLHGVGLLLVLCRSPVSMQQLMLGSMLLSPA